MSFAKKARFHSVRLILLGAMLSFSGLFGGTKKLSILLRDESFKMVLEAGMPSFYSGYAEV
jgi:hypothetical protein